MAEASHDAKPTKNPQEKNQQEKKQPETVLLSADELRAIAGGATINGPGTSTQGGAPDPAAKGIVRR
jgi:hypothetical protein